MTNRLQEINHKLARSSQQFNKVVKTILVEESPLAPPRYHQYKNHNISQDQLINPEIVNKRQNNLQSTLKNQSQMQIPQIEYNNNSFEKTKPKFYTPQKQKLTNRAKISAKSKFSVQGHLYKHNIGHQQYSQLIANNSMITDEHNKSYTPKKISQIDHRLIIEYVNSNNKLTNSSSPEQVFDYFYHFVPFIQKPLIKKFKNCLFFGDPSAKNSSKINKKYEGFLYFYNNKLYYGDLQNQHKNGIGVEINLNTNTVYKGTFDKGHKIGKFKVFRDQQTYQGYLSKGKYHGIGKLQTSLSIYTGSFHQGERHGKGQQYFFKSGLKLIGDFYHNKFSNTKVSSQISNPENQIDRTHSRGIRKKSRVNFLPKINHIMQFSYCDASQSQDLDNKINYKHLLQNDTYLDMCHDQEEEDGPLPSPFRKFGIYSNTTSLRR